jgi:predicted phage-related endonuclease
MTQATITKTITTTAEVARTVVELEKEMNEIIDRFVEVRDLINTLDKEKKALDALIKQALAGAEAGSIDNKVRVTVSQRSREGVNAKTLAEVFPEAYEATKTVTEYSVLTIK